MINRKAIAAAFLLVFAGSSFYAQKSSIDFKGVCQNLAKHPIIRGDYELAQYVHISKKALNSSGKFTLSNKDGIIWFGQNPIKSTTAVTKNYFVTELGEHLKKIDGAKIPAFKDVANIIASLFTGDYETLNEHFVIDYTTEIDGKEVVWKAVLTPKDKTISTYLGSVELCGTYDGKTAYVEIFNIIQKNGDKSNYLLKNHVFVDKLTDNEIRFFE